MPGDYDEYGHFEPRAKPPLVYWFHWVMIALTFLVSAVECFDRQQRVMGWLFVAGILATFFAWRRQRLKNGDDLRP